MEDVAEARSRNPLLSDSNVRATSESPHFAKQNPDSVRSFAELPIQPPDHPRSAYLSAIAVDKKKQGGKIHFVVLKGIGSATTAALRPQDILPIGWKA